MMKSLTFAVVAIALFVGAYSLPVAEDTWSDQDEMLARVFSDASPVASLIQADPSTVKHSADEAATNSDAAAAAKAEEDQYTAEESKLEAKAAKLHAAEDALAAKAATDNAKASADAASYAADAVAASAAASKASADAEAAHQAAMAAYNKTLADLAAAGDAADQATKDRLSAEKKTADDTAAALAQATADGVQAAADLAASEKKLADAKAGIATTYASAMEDIIAQNNSNNAAMAKEAADWQATYESNQTSNAEKAALATDHLAAEKTKNEADAKAAMDSIDAKYAAKKAATDAAKAAFAAKQDADAKALASARADTQAHFAKIAADNQAEYEAKMAVADEMQADADEAHATYEQALADSETEQKAIDAMTANTVAADNEMKGCTTEQCLNDAGVCTDLKDASGTQHFWINSVDLVTCTTTPTGQYGAAYNAGAARAGIGAALTLAPIPAPSDACMALFDGTDTRLGSFPESAQKIISDFDCKSDMLPLDAFICDPDLSPEQVQVALKFFTEAGATCPMWCVPGSETYTDDGVAVTHGTCLTQADWGHFKQIVEDTPEYHNIGTVMDSTGEGRFAADNQWNKRMCDQAKSFMSGFTDGSAKN
jgi:hypothetical protein